MDRWTVGPIAMHPRTASPCFSSSAHVSAPESLALGKSLACQQLGLTKWSPTPEWNVVQEKDLFWLGLPITSYPNLQCSLTMTKQPKKLPLRATSLLHPSMRAQTFQCLVEGFDDVPPIDCLFLAIRDRWKTKQTWPKNPGRVPHVADLSWPLRKSSRSFLSLIKRLNPILARFRGFPLLVDLHISLENPYGTQEFKFLLRQSSKPNFLGVHLGFIWLSGGHGCL